jgi:hypothetical protein
MVSSVEGQLQQDREVLNVVYSHNMMLIQSIHHDGMLILVFFVGGKMMMMMMMMIVYMLSSIYNPVLVDTSTKLMTLKMKMNLQVVVGRQVLSYHHSHLPHSANCISHVLILYSL